MTQPEAKPDIGKTVFPQNASGAARVAEAIGLDCLEPEEVGHWAKPLNSTSKSGLRGQVRSTKPLTLDVLCSHAPTDWCIGAAQAGRCIRSVKWWLGALRAKLAAAACGCDPLWCPACNTGGSPKAVCKGCQALTGWERSPEGRFALARFERQLNGETTKAAASAETG